MFTQFRRCSARCNPFCLPLVAAILGAGLSIAADPLGPEVPETIPRESETKIDDARLEYLLKIHHTEQQEVRLVILPAVVTNRQGKIVTGLDAEDFSLSEDHVPQQIRYFGTETVDEISVAFLLDISGSMRQVGKLAEAKESIRVFIDALQPGDQFGLICFAGDQVAWITEFTDDRKRFLERLNVQEGYGQTALFDALAATPKLVAEELEGRKAIVLITDGTDNASRMNTLRAVQVARQVNVPIYIIGFRSLVDEMMMQFGKERGLPVLQRFADETGGTMFSVYDPDDLKEAVLRIQQELRFQYVIGYHPSRNLYDGTFRRVKLEASGRRLSVRTRSGYYANP